MEFDPILAHSKIKPISFTVKVFSQLDASQIQEASMESPLLCLREKRQPCGLFCVVLFRMGRNRFSKKNAWESALEWTLLTHFG